MGEEEGRVEVCAAVLKGELQGAEQETPTFDTTPHRGSRLTRYCQAQTALTH